MFKEREDHWGIKRAVREIFNSTKGYTKKYKLLKEDDFLFDAFFYQFLPDIWKDSLESVIRHREDIEKLIHSRGYDSGCVWIRRGKQMKCVPLNHELSRNLESLDLPTYSEIEDEKTRWQQHPRYDKSLGVSVGLKEEYVRLRVVKKTERR